MQTRFVAALLLLLAISTLARAADAMQLFDDPAATENTAPNEVILNSRVLAGTSQARLGRLDADVLDAFIRPGMRAMLALFPGAEFMIQSERVNVTAAGSHIVTGVLPDQPEGRFTFVVQDHLLTGAVRTATRTFQILPIAEGDLAHAIMEIDQTTLPTCGLRPSHELPQAAGAPPIQLGQAGGGPVIVDVLVLYTPAARQTAGGTNLMRSFVELAVAETNEAYQLSQVNHRLRLVHTAETNYQETGGSGSELSRLAGSGDGFMDEAHVLRNQYGADLVSLITEALNACGVAYLLPNTVNGNANLGFSVVARSCAVSNHTFAHELGHNFGCQHDRDNAGNPNRANYEYGYRAPGSVFRTIMAYPPGTRVQRFSNPDITFSGQPCGSPLNSATPTHNARLHNETAGIVANYRQTIDADCNGNGTPDVEDLSSGFSVDCTGNFVPDECDIASGDVPDCNGNSVPDGCDLAAGAPDCNLNQSLDSCEIASGQVSDCNANAVPDACDLASAASTDCDENLVPDECDLAAHPEQDCNRNGVLDYCDTAPEFEQAAAPQGPIGVGFARQFDFAAPPEALDTATIEVTARGDFNTQSEFLTVALNGSTLGNLFVTGFTDCAPNGETDQIQLPMGAFNELVGAGPASVLLTPSPGVNPGLCDPASFASVTLRYGAAPKFADVNGDRIPDVCQTSLSGDMNCNGVVNVGDIAGFVLAITDPAGYAAQFPTCDINNADVNTNGVINVGDIGVFVALITGG